MRKILSLLQRNRFVKLFALPVIASWLARGILRLILMTCKIRFVNDHSFDVLSRKGGCIMLLWHNRMALVNDFLFKCGGLNCYSLVVSASRDGRLLSSMTATNPHARVIQVPKNDRHGALRLMMKALKRKEVLLVTPDGPRGPCYKVKPGALYAAQQLKAPLIPFSYSCSRYWELKSWDRMRIPKPFSTITVGAGPALEPPAPGADMDAEVEKFSAALVDWDRQI